MSFITSISHNNTPYDINTDAMAFDEHGVQVPVRILGFQQAPNGIIHALCRIWEPSALRTPRNHGPNYHEYHEQSVALKAEQVVFPITSFVKAIEVLHYLAFKKVDLVFKEDMLFFAYVYGDDNKAKRASKTALPSPCGRAANTRMVGTMLRDAVEDHLRRRGANKGRTTLLFPFYRDEVLAILRTMVGPPTPTTSGMVYRIAQPEQLDALCHFSWEVFVFHGQDNWYNTVTSMTIKIPTNGRITIHLKFALMRRVFDIPYRQHTLQYWH